MRNLWMNDLLAPCSRLPRAAGALARLALAGVAIGVASCDTQPPPPGVDTKTVDADAKEFVETVPAMPRLFQPQDPVPAANFRFEVFVDQSASMAGYVDYARNWPKTQTPSPSVPYPLNGLSDATRAPASADRSRTRRPGASPAAPDAPVDSAFVRLLREFANEEELMGYFGFGSDASAPQTIVPYGRSAPLDPKQYVRLNNDYADLLGQFAARPATADGLPVVRVIVTDGVQSHSAAGMGSALSQTVQKLQEWVKTGGVVEVRLLEAPFAGTYYSEELRARQRPVSFGGRVAERPFIVISLLPSSADLPAWDRFWKRSAMAGLAPVSVVRCPVEAAARPLTLEPEERIPKEVPTQVLYRNVWDLSRIETLDGYHNVWRAGVRRPRTQASATPATYPACFLCKGFSAAASGADAEAEFRQMRPVLEVWQGPGTGGKKPAGVGDGKDWNRLDSIDLRDFQNGKVSVARVGGAPDTFRLTAALPLPPPRTVQAVVLTATPLAVAATPPDWEKASTLDDSSAANLGKIYNLQPFVEQLIDRTTRPAPPVGLLVLPYR